MVSWKINDIYALNAGNRRTPLITDTDVYVNFDVCEPLMLSPFIFGSDYGKQGFYGIQAMNFQMVLTGNAYRAWRCANMGSEKTATVVEFNNSRLLFQCLTLRASDMLGPRSVVPYYEIPVFKTTSNEDLPGRVNR
ncbi:MAG: phage major capsid domain-containing protein, partial [Candidatus Fonsibacter sp.]